jgi:hypothetical protein
MAATPPGAFVATMARVSGEPEPEQGEETWRLCWEAPDRLRAEFAVGTEDGDRLVPRRDLVELVALTGGQDQRRPREHGPRQGAGRGPGLAGTDSPRARLRAAGHGHGPVAPGLPLEGPSVHPG